MYAIVGISPSDKVKSSKPGDAFDDIIVLDPLTGLILIDEPEYDYLYNDDDTDYIKSFIFDRCDKLALIYSKKIDLLETDLPIPEMDKSEYALSDTDYNTGKAFNLLIIGKTASGKTYKAITDEIEAGRRFAYIAPCRQLVYESYRYYANKDLDTLSTGEVKINSDSNGNFFGVYESMYPELLAGYDTLIIDEAHFIKDRDRGKLLLTLITECREKDINIKLLTATQNFVINDFDQIILTSHFKVPKKVEISMDMAYINIERGMQTIWFCGSIDDTRRHKYELNYRGIKAAAINSASLPSERLRVQIAFENKDIQVVCTTNVLAQGVNFECENLIIERDPFETPEQQQQKLGRLGRPGTLNDRDEVYYAICNKLDKPKIPKIKTKIKKTEYNDMHVYNQLRDAISNIERGRYINYNDIKYCIPQFKKYANEFIQTKQKEYNISENDVMKKFSKQIAVINSAIKMITHEEEELKSIILNNMRSTPSLI